MHRFWTYVRVLGVSGLSVFGSACGDDVQCGPGTKLVGNACVPGAEGAPPTFGGVTAVAPSTTTSLFVAWDAAKSTTPEERMRYLVFAAETGTPIDYAKPTVTTERGAHSAYLKDLQNKSYDVAVRALDDGERSDQNVVVKSAVPALDSASPTFGGVKSAEAAGSGVVTLKWDAAQDDLTPGGAMVYLVYVGDETKDIDFKVPTTISKPGATSIDVKGLFKSSSLYRFVMRARDAADNTDGNTAILTSRPGRDVTPPRFAGCNAAVADSAGSAILSWTKAVDDVTPDKEIAYDIFASVDETRFDFTTPIMIVTDAESARVTGLLSDTPWRFVCRARDYSGNHDGNVAQRTTRTPSDSTPPSFAGATGTVVDTLARTVTLSWTPGADDKTPTDQLIYDVYESTKSNAQAFDGPPRASSEPGATSVTVVDLLPDSKLFWVVRARDQGGNRDANIVESSGTISTSFERQVQPIFSLSCAVTGCHIPGNPMANLILAEGFAYRALVNVRAYQFNRDFRVLPGKSEDSYLYKKIKGDSPPIGWQMPAPATKSVLSQNEKDLIKRWIDQGAVNN